MKTYKKYLITEAPKKGDIVDFHNDLGKMVQGQITKINGDDIVITVHGVKFKRKLKDIKG